MSKEIKRFSLNALELQKHQPINDLDSVGHMSFIAVSGDAFDSTPMTLLIFQATRKVCKFLRSMMASCENV